jgi:hypothetical protein
MQGHTARAMRRAREQGTRKLLGERVLGVPAALGVASDHQRDRRGKAVFDQPGMGRGIRGLEEGLMPLCALRGALR